MSTNLYVGNLSFDVTEATSEACWPNMAQNEIKIIMDKFTGVGRAFAFVTMNTPEGNAAVLALNGKEWQGRALTIDVARPREDRSARSSNYGRPRHF